MNELPLHPMVVHLPLGLALVVPLVAFGVLAYSFKREWLAPMWGIVVLLQLVMVGGAFFAMRTGEDQEQVVARIVPHEALEHHEEAAELFSYAGLAVLVLGAAALLPMNQKKRQGLGAATVVGSVAVAAMGLEAGEHGGELVYEYGASRAYANPAYAAPVISAPRAAAESSD